MKWGERTQRGSYSTKDLTEHERLSDFMYIQLGASYYTTWEQRKTGENEHRRSENSVNDTQPKWWTLQNSKKH
jgi:hypothetical protein